MLGVVAVREKRTDVAVKIDAKIVGKARSICGYRGVSMAKFLSDLLEPLVAKKYEEFRRDVTSGKPPEKPKVGKPDKPAAD